MQSNKELMCCEDSPLKLISDTHRVLEEWVLFWHREGKVWENLAVKLWIPLVPKWSVTCWLDLAKMMNSEFWTEQKHRTVNGDLLTFHWECGVCFNSVKLKKTEISKVVHFDWKGNNHLWEKATFCFVVPIRQTNVVSSAQNSFGTQSWTPQFKYHVYCRSHTTPKSLVF